MKKPLALLLTLLLLAACAAPGDAPSTPEGAELAGSVPVRVTALKGPTAMGMAQLMDAADSGGLPQYAFTLAGSVDEVVPQLVRGTADIAAIPANLAAALYQNTEGGIQTLAINTLGVLYLVERGETVYRAEDLRGRTIFASGKGATPEYVLRHILARSGLDPDADVDIQWKSEHAECLTALLSAQDAVALLPQPFVTSAQMKSEEIRVALDLNALWEGLQEGGEAPSALITGVAVVRRAFALEHPEAVNAFLEHYQASVDYVNANPAQAAALIEQYGILAADVAERALPACAIVCIQGEEMAALLSGYLSVLFAQNPAAVGGVLPDEEFYYVR